MSEVKLSSDEIRYIALFESLTGASARDCVIDEENDRIIFVVNEGDMGLAIGKEGSNIKKVKEAIGHRIEVVEYSDSLEQFVKNTLSPAEVNGVDVSGQDENEKKVIKIEVNESKKGLVIGKNGRNIEKAKMLGDRHHNIGDIKIE